jgi:hypothetical protein
MAEPSEPEPEPDDPFDVDDSALGIALTLGIDVAFFCSAALVTTATLAKVDICRCLQQRGAEGSKRAGSTAEQQLPEQGRHEVQEGQGGGLAPPADDLSAWRKAFFKDGMWLRWPWMLLQLPDARIRQLVGERAVCFLRFQRVLLSLMAVYLVVGLCIIVPINMTNGECNFQRCITDRAFPSIVDRVMFMSSSENIREGDEARLGAYFVIVVFFTVYSYKSTRPNSLFRQMMDRERQLRPTPRQEDYSIMARKVPGIATAAAITRTLSQEFSGHPDILSLNVAPASGVSSSAVVSAHVFGGTAFVTFRTNSLAAAFCASHHAQFGGPPPRCWCCCCFGGCYWCWYRFLRRPHLAAYWSSLWAPHFTAAHKDAVHETETTALLSTHDSSSDEVVFSQQAVDWLGLGRWQRVQWAPPPDDIIWKHIATPGWQRGVRWAAMSSVLLVVICLLIFPLALVQPVVHNVADKLFEWFGVDPASSTRQLLFKYLPTLLALIINAGIVPELIEAQAALEGHFRRSDATRGCLRKQNFFLFAAIAIFPALGIIGFALSFEAFVERIAPEAAFELVAREVLSAQAPYFIRYITHAALLSTGCALLLWQKRFVTCFARCCLCGKGPRLRWKFPFEYHYAMCCCIFSVVLIQGTFFPTLLPFGLLFMILKYFSDTFVLLFGHGAQHVDESSGKELRQEEAELSQRTEMQEVSSFLAFVLAVFNFVAIAFFLIKLPSPASQPISWTFAQSPLSHLVAIAAVLMFVAAVIFTTHQCNGSVRARAAELPAHFPAYDEAVMGLSQYHEGAEGRRRRRSSVANAHVLQPPVHGHFPVPVSRLDRRRLSLTDA